MRLYASLIVIVIAIALIVGYAPTNAQSTPAATAAAASQSVSFQLTIPTVKNRIFAVEQTGNSNGCTGGNVSPEIDWSGAPSGTQSYAVTMYDIDAPTGSGLWHWLVFNIPASATSLPAGAGDPTKNLLPAGSVMGTNDLGIMGYFGPCPSPGDRPHRYLISVFALKTAKLSLDQKASGARVGGGANGNMLAKATTIVIYGRPSALQVTSPVLTDSGTFQTDQVGTNCKGGSVSPEIDWSGAPSGTQSYSVSMYDMDAPTGSGLWHWVVLNIPASATSLPAGAGDPTKNLLPAGAIMARNDPGMNAYTGPCPPPGDQPHRYLIMVSALSAKLPLDQNASGAVVGFYVNGMALARTTIVAVYGR